MGFRLLDSGKWYGEFQHNGARKGSLLFHFTKDKEEPTCKKDAQAAFETFCAKVRTGKAWAPTNADAKMSISEFVDYYIENYWHNTETMKDRQESRTGNDGMAIFNAIKRHFGNQPLVLFNNPQTFVNYQKWLVTTPIDVVKRVKVGDHYEIERTPSARRRGRKTISGYRMRIRHMCAFAKAFDLIETNPFLDDRIKKFMGKAVASEGRCRRVTETEYKALIDACQQLDDPKAMEERIKVSFKLGPRRGEMLRTQLKDIDFENWTWTFPGFKVVNKKRMRNTKNGKDRVIPISPDLETLFKTKRTLFDKDAFLFGDDGVYVRDFKIAWATLKDHAKLDDATLLKAGKMDLHWHDLRGEAATRMLDEGTAPATVADIVGNTVEVLLKHYKGDLMKSMRAAVGRAK